VTDQPPRTRQHCRYDVVCPHNSPHRPRIPHSAGFVQGALSASLLPAALALVQMSAPPVAYRAGDSTAGPPPRHDATWVWSVPGGVSLVWPYVDAGADPSSVNDTPQSPTPEEGAQAVGLLDWGGEGNGDNASDAAAGVDSMRGDSGEEEAEGASTPAATRRLLSWRCALAQRVGALWFACDPRTGAQVCRCITDTVASAITAAGPEYRAAASPSAPEARYLSALAPLLTATDDAGAGPDVAPSGCGGTCGWGAGDCSASRGHAQVEGTTPSPAC